MTEPRWFTANGVTADISDVPIGRSFTLGPAFTLPPIPSPAPKPPGYRLICLLATASMRWQCNAKLLIGDDE